MKKKRTNNKLSLDHMHRKIQSAQAVNTNLKEQLKRQEKLSVGIVVSDEKEFGDEDNDNDEVGETTNLMKNQDLQVLYGFRNEDLIE